MATTKVSALAAHTTTDGAEELLINDGGTSKKVTIANLLHDNSIDSDHYVDGSIDEAHIADDAVTADKLANAINTAIAANTAKTTNATHTGDVTGSGALTIAAGAVDIAHLSASGTAGSSNFLRGDNSWVTPTDTDTTYSAGSSSALGLIKLEDDATQTTAASAITTTAARTYGLQINSSGQGVVNVPWADTNTTYSVTDCELSQNNFTNTLKTKLDGIEASADVTDATNVTAAGALMDSELAGIAAVKATTGTFLTADQTKLDGIEASADVTDATNVTAAGALMDSEVTNLAAVKSFAAADYATAAQGTKADAALPKAGGTMTGAVVGATDTDTSNSGTVDLDFTADTNFVLTLTGNITSLTASNEVAGQSGFIVFIQDGTGGRTVSLHGDYETAAGAGLTLTSTASATDIVPYVVAASSRILLGTPQLAFS